MEAAKAVERKTMDRALKSSAAFFSQLQDEKGSKACPPDCQTACLFPGDCPIFRENFHLQGHLSDLPFVDIILNYFAWQRGG